MAFKVNQQLSLMIPRVFPQWVDEQKIIDIFHGQHIGRVYKVSINRLPDIKKRKIPIYQAFVYFSAWYDNEIAYNFQQRIYGPKAQACVVYDDPWHWVVFENTKQRLSNNDKRIIRAGYQTYLAEQLLLEQNERIEKIEQWCKQSEMIAIAKATNAKNLAEAAEKILGEELELTETAMNVAESVLMDLDYDDDEYDYDEYDYNEAYGREPTTMNMEVDSDEENYFKESRLHGWMMN